MKINAENGFYRGLGDIVCFAWIGAGCRGRRVACEFYAKDWRADLLRAFGQDVTDDPTGAVTARVGYEKAIVTGSSLNYLEWICDQLEIPVAPVRPKITLPAKALGRTRYRVLVFPHGSWTPRTWPKTYFIELALLLQKAGIDPLIITRQRDYFFISSRRFHCTFNQSLTTIAAWMQMADLVIGNDSGPAHFAGTLGTKVLTVHGPTTERIYGHLPEVTCFRKRALPCAGCHCQPPYRISCEAGCFELMRTYPEEVFDAAMALLNPQSAIRDPKFQRCAA